MSESDALLVDLLFVSNGLPPLPDVLRDCRLVQRLTYGQSIERVNGMLVELGERWERPVRTYDASTAWRWSTAVFGIETPRKRRTAS